MKFEQNDISPEAQEQEKFRVAWKNKTTEATGCGEYVDKETADTWLKEENEKHPELEHWLESEKKKEIDLEEVKNKIIESGIAERMLNTLKEYKGKLDPEITYGIEDCNFRVEVTEEESPENPNETVEVVQIIIEHPNLRESGDSMVQQAFSVKEGESFGAGGENSLTEEQFNLIQEIIREQKENPE